MLVHLGTPLNTDSSKLVSYLIDYHFSSFLNVEDESLLGKRFKQNLS